MRKLLALILALSLCLTMCACGAGSTRVRAVKTLVEQEYSLAFRNEDPIAYYITAAIEALCAEGKVEELSHKWFGSDVVTFAKNSKTFEDIALPDSRVFIIGVDINSFPLAYSSNGSYWGFDVELAQSVCDKLGWTLRVQPIEKENVYIELSSGNIDCAWGGIALNQKEIDDHKFTQYGPYIHNDIVIASREGSGVWNSLRLGNKNMAMPTTPEAMDALNTDEGMVKRLGQITRLAGGTTECFNYLLTGKCNAILTDSTAILYYNCH